MYARVAGADFKRNVSSVIPTSSKVLLNFLVEGDALRVQVIGNLITETSIPILEKDGNDKVDITVQAKLALALIDKDQDVYLEFQQDLVIITQPQFEFQATREWEKRYSIPEFDESSAFELDREEFNSIIQMSKTLDAIVRETKQTQSDIMFVKSKAYVNYSGEVLIMNTTIPDDFAFTAETARNLNSFLDSKSRVCINHVKGYAIIKSKYKTVHATITRANVHMVEALNERLSSSASIGTMSLIPMAEKIDTLNKLYKSGKVTLSITKDNISLQVTDGKTTFAFGSKEIPLLSIRFTTLHLAAINRLYKDAERVSVRSGGNILCLQDNRVQLLVSGTLF